MCQLLALNANVPTDICSSFTGFRARGGLTDDHKDGWGIAFFEGRGVRQFLDEQASAHSPLAEFIKSYPIRSTNIVAHIRKATRGRVALENAHPFSRELWGRYWIFAHNGTLNNFEAKLTGRFQPVGETDSELAFCWILDQLHSHFGEAQPADREFFAFIRELCLKLGCLGEFNFLLSNGDFLLAHCSTRLAWISRKTPFGTGSPGGTDGDPVVVDIHVMNSKREKIVVFATTPLSNSENWKPLEPGTLLFCKEGEIVMQERTVAGVKTVQESDLGSRQLRA